MKYLSDVRFWIVLFFIIRLYGITFPPLEIGHNWRQTTVAMVSRNFLEVDANILYPRVDIGGEKTGITGMEFPIFNYFIYGVAKVFGYQHWYGRLVNLIISSFGLYFFYLLVKKYFQERTAFYGTVILAVSIWFQFSRKIMPDTFSMSLVIASLYYGTNYLKQKRHQYRHLILFSVLFLLGVLSKLPSGYLLVLMAMYIPIEAIPWRKKIIFASVALLMLIPIIGWYFFWVPYLVTEFGFWHFFMGISLTHGAHEIMGDLPRTLGRFYETALQFSGFFAFMLGIYYAIKNRNTLLKGIVICSFLVFGVFILKAGLNFSKHNYYIIPWVPVMALTAGYGLTQLKNKKFTYFILAFIVVEGIGNQHSDFILKPQDAFILNMETELATISNKEDLFFVNSGDYPTVMYFAHRKGWVGPNEYLLNADGFGRMKSNGLKYVLILKQQFGSHINLPDMERVFESPDYTVYRIE